jgi:thiol-disulfide isomerase/thioredoxin
VGEAAATSHKIDLAMLEGLGAHPRERITLLQFSSAYCAPCRAMSRISSEVAGEVPGVRHIEVDAEEHLDAVRALGIWRTPTLLVLDREGRVLKRATGVPRKPQLIAAVTETL